MNTAGLTRGSLSNEFERLWLREDNRLASRRRRYWRERIVEMMRTALLREVRQHGFSPSEIEAYAALVVERREDPYRLVPRLIAERFAVMEEGS